MTILTVVAAGLAALIGAAVGYFAQQHFGHKKTSGQEERIEKKVQEAKQQLVALKQQTDNEARTKREAVEKELDERRAQLVELEKSIADREHSIVEKQNEVAQQQTAAKDQVAAIEVEREELVQLRNEEEQKLAEIAGLTQEQAASRVLELAEERTKEDVLRRVRKLEQEGEQQFKDKGKMMLINAIQRYGSSQVSEFMSSYVAIPDEGMIGRIIGKEGRNIQHLERMTGCEIIVDEAPNTIMVTGFSPLRRQVAKTAIEQLVKDGRIHPGRIEGVVEEAKKQINEDIRAAGEAALYELGIIDFPEKLVHLVGRLKYRTSYSQNMLSHSVEVAHVATMLAQELGADVQITKKAALLHDIGKAIDHDVEGNHVEIGDKIMRKFALDERIIQAANPHDEGYIQRSVEAVIVQVADAVSAARPGARRESLEQYVKRMVDLENIATSYEGVQKCYAIHAGREVRVFVYPDKVDDLQATKIAQQIAKQIESELKYPGDVKVNVIRETRAEATAR